MMEKLKILLVLLLVCGFFPVSGLSRDPPQNQPEAGRDDKLKSIKNKLLLKKYVRNDKQRQGFWVCRLPRGLYVVRSNVSPEFTLEKTQLLERLFKNFRRHFKDQFKANLRKPRPGALFFKTKAQFRQFCRAEMKGAATWGEAFYDISKRRLVLHCEGSKDRLRTSVQHEGTHQLLHLYTGNAWLPTWFNEGCATFFEVWDFDNLTPKENCKKAIERSYRLGIVQKTYGTKKWFDLSHLLDLTAKAWSKEKNMDKIHQNYSEAWCFMNFMLSTDRGVRVFNKLLSIMRKRHDPKKVITPAVLKNWQKHWYEYIEKRVMTIDISKTKKPQ